MKFKVVIPARYASTRLPGKPLADILGKPMIAHVAERALASGAEEVFVATDDLRIAKALEPAGIPVLMTSSAHQSGTERLAEVVELLSLKDDEIIVNVQGDEPLIPPKVIHQVAEALATQTLAPMATLATPIFEAADFQNPNVVKLVTDHQGYALYFSRAALPYLREVKRDTQTNTEPLGRRHIGIYSYRAGFIQQYANWPASPIEQIEQLEQLRVLWYQEKIKVVDALEVPPAGIDTPEDLERVRTYLKSNPKNL